MPRFSCAICFNRDNTISYANRVLQIERTRWRRTLPGCWVLLCEHLDSGLTVYCGPHLGRFADVDAVTSGSSARETRLYRFAAA